MNNVEKVCKRCVMDTTADNIVFDENGYCNLCTEFLELLNTPKEKLLPFQGNLDLLVEEIKKSGKGKKYDCIVGLSGGVDSSYLLVKVVELGLRPLAVHMDNGWNSEEATNNIKNLVSKLGVDLYTYVIDWEEYKQLQQAFFDADVIDIELLYDNAMMATWYIPVREYGVKYIMAGYNIYTEGFKIPKTWNWFKYDKKNIKSIAKKFGVKIKTLPMIGTMDFIYYTFLRGVRVVPLLNYLPEYNKFKAIEILENNYGYKRYPYKHYESVFTRFYQGYILPRKFNVDKRKVHFSNLILTGQMTREEALKDLQKIPYESEELLEQDIQYFLKKMGWTREQLEEYLKRPRKEHYEYGSEYKLYYFLANIYKKFFQT